jgi:hypothetical protein
MFSRHVLTASLLLAATTATLRADLVWTSAGGNVIETAGRDGSNARTLINLVALTGNSNPEPRGITSDGTTYLYWTDLGQNGTGSGAGIYRANFDGSGAVRLIDPVAALGGAVGDYSPEGILIAADKIYWTDFGKSAVYFADLDGSNVALFASGVANPRGITAAAGRIYWHGQTARKIFSADEDGGNPADFFDYATALPAVANPWDLHSDGVNLYLTDPNLGSQDLFVINIATKAPFTIVEDVNALGVVFAEGVLYFTDEANNRLYKVGDNGQDLAELLIAPSGDARGITLIAPQPLPPVATAKASPGKITENSRKPLTFTITLARAATSRLTLPYTIGGTARSGRDFTPRMTSGTVVIPQGQTRATVSLRMKNDRTKEKKKTITLNVATGIGYLPGAAATATLLDDDK